MSDIILSDLQRVTLSFIIELLLMLFFKPETGAQRD